jgi:hypothetical protein
VGRPEAAVPAQPVEGQPRPRLEVGLQEVADLGLVVVMAEPTRGALKSFFGFTVEFVSAQYSRSYKIYINLYKSFNKTN